MGSTFRFTGSIIASSFSLGTWSSTSASTLTITLGAVDVAFSGSFTFDGSGAVSGGTLDGMVWTIGTGATATIADLDVDMSTLLALIGASDAAGIDDLMFSKDWSITGNEQMQTINTLTLTGAGNRVKYSGIDTVSLLDGNDQFFAHDGADHVDGGADDDQLWGAHGADTLPGGTGDDMVDGGKGRDSIFCEKGNDTFVFRDETASVTDVVLDFELGVDLRLKRAATGCPKPFYALLESAVRVSVF